MRRRFTITALALIAAAAPPVQPPPPAGLAPYLHDGRFDPGDYGWMRGAFPGASVADRAAWQQIGEWTRQCPARQAAAIRAGLAIRGVAAIYSAQGVDGRPCDGIDYVRPRGDAPWGGSWSDFQGALARGRPVAQAIVWSAALAQRFADPDAPGLAAALIARPTTDQLLRSSVSWEKGDVAGAPPLDPAALGIAQGLIWFAIAKRDHANTAWLKAEVAAHGWPSIPKVGQEASHMAWLLVQHADDDPVFQLDMLRLMEPLATRGDVAKKDYAYLYDRVMLKLTGKQRFGTQFTCRDGRHQPLPLEDADTVAARRAAMGMETLAQNVARMDASYGPCPPDKP